MTTNAYAELHCHSNYSFQEGASSVGELLARAKELGYPALALTDHDNLCGAMEFSRTANSLGIRPITGAEITLKDGSHLTLWPRHGRATPTCANSSPSRGSRETGWTRGWTHGSFPTTPRGLSC